MKGRLRRRRSRRRRKRRSTRFSWPVKLCEVMRKGSLNGYLSSGRWRVLILQNLQTKSYQTSTKVSLPSKSQSTDLWPSATVPMMRAQPAIRWPPFWQVSTLSGHR